MISWVMFDVDLLKYVKKKGSKQIVIAPLVEDPCTMQISDIINVFLIYPNIS